MTTGHSFVTGPGSMPQGLFFDVPEDEYHRKELGVLSCTGMKQALRSPAHYRAWLAAPDDEKETAAKKFGKALHCAVLEPARFATAYQVLPADAPRKPSITQINAKNPSADTVLAIQYYERLRRSGRIIIASEDMARINAMAASIAAHPWAQKMLQGGVSEVVARWTDERTGLPCKLRADYLRDPDSSARLCIDVKAVRDASPRGFQRALWEYLYPLQWAHYTEGFKRVQRELAGFVFLCVENEAPFVAQPYVLEPDTEAAGEMLRARGADIIARCVQTGIFPGYSDDLLSISLPPWAIREIEDKEPA